MTKRIKLKGREKDFFLRVSEAAFANPFSTERETLDEGIADCPPDSPPEIRLEMLLARVSEEIALLERKGCADLRLYGAEERFILISVFLFEILHIFADDFDRLIVDQEKGGSKPCTVPFATDMLGRFAARGFDADEAVRFAAMLYQLRRAFHFIDAGLIGESPSMKSLRLSLWDNVFTRDILIYERYLWDRMEDFSTILLGETGTGKGTAAAAIGRSGFIPFDESRGRFAASFTDVFLPVNLALYPESLIESELFGHRKGAFTGAVEDHRGIFAACSPYGAIFLDEIGDASPAVQVKLLRVLQERVFSPVGSHEGLRFEGRVIAASNQPLAELREKKLFREDFYYRLCSDCIVVPPLRQRLEEYPGEMENILRAIVGRIMGAADEEIIRNVEKTIHDSCGRGYGWPGNVRELEQAVRRVLLTGKYRPDGRKEPVEGLSRLLADLSEGALTADELLDSYCSLLYRRHGTYEEVARRTALDRRTVKKYLSRAR